MRILTRYVLGEVISHAAIGIAVFTFVLFTRDLGHILEVVVRNSAPLPSVAEIFFFTVPVALTYTIPMGVLVGILIGLSRLAADSEITAMRASGIGVWTFLRIISIFVAFAWLLALATGVYLAPRSQAALGRLQDRLKGSQVSFEVQPRVFYEGFRQLVLYVQDVKSAQGAAIWKGVFIADISTPSSPRITLAREGILVSEGTDRLHLHLSDGATHETDSQFPDRYQISTFQRAATGSVFRASGGQQAGAGTGPDCATEDAGIAPAGPEDGSSCGALVLYRVPSPLRTTHSLRRVGAGGHPPGSGVEKGRQIGGFRSHHPAGGCLLFGFAGGSFAGTSGDGLTRVGRLAGEHRLLSGRRVSVVACGTPAFRDSVAARPLESVQIEIAGRRKKCAPPPGRGCLPARGQPPAGV